MRREVPDGQTCQLERENIHRREFLLLAAANAVTNDDEKCMKSNAFNPENPGTCRLNSILVVRTTPIVDGGRLWSVWSVFYMVITKTSEYGNYGNRYIKKLCIGKSLEWP